MHSCGATTPSTWNGVRGREPGSRTKSTRPSERSWLSPPRRYGGAPRGSVRGGGRTAPRTRAPLQQGEVTVITCETIQAGDGSFPVLHPTSEVAGRLAPIIAGSLLETMLPHGADDDAGGRGILLSGIPGLPPASVVILGAGVGGGNAARAFVRSEER